MALLMPLPSLLLVHLFMGQVNGMLKAPIAQSHATFGQGTGPSMALSSKNPSSSVQFKSQIPQTLAIQSHNTKKSSRLYAAVHNKLNGPLESEDMNKMKNGEMGVGPLDSLNMQISIPWKNDGHIQGEKIVIRWAGPEDTSELLWLSFQANNHQVPAFHNKPEDYYSTEGEEYDHVAKWNFFEEEKRRQIGEDLQKGVLGPLHMNAIVAERVDEEDKKHGIADYLLFHQCYSVTGSSVYYNSHGVSTQSGGTIIRLDESFAWNMNHKKSNPGIAKAMMETLKNYAESNGIRRIEMAIPRNNEEAIKFVESLDGIEKRKDDVLWVLSKEKFERVKMEHFNDSKWKVKGDNIFSIPEDRIEPKITKNSNVCTINVIQSPKVVAQAIFHCYPYRTWASQHIWLEKVMMYASPESMQYSIVAILSKLVEYFEGNRIDGFKWIADKQMMKNYGEYFDWLGAKSTHDSLAIYHWKLELKPHKNTIRSIEEAEEDNQMNKQ